MKLDLNVPGFGWKAATIDALRWPFFALAPVAPLAIPLMNIPALYHLCWPLAQRAIRVSEALLPASMTDWHTYELVWQPSAVLFFVDGQIIHITPSAPRGPLGFVMWLDNQYMVITPWGRFRYGLLGATGPAVAGNRPIGDFHPWLGKYICQSKVIVWTMVKIQITRDK